MGSIAERTPAINQTLAEAQLAFSEYQNTTRELARKTAKKVVEAGGVTDKEVFIFAMHGIMTSFTRQPNEPEKNILDEYDRLCTRFERLAADTPVAETYMIYGKATIRCAGLPKTSKDEGPSIRFLIEQSGTGYSGSVELPITNVHSWAFNTPVNQPGLAAESVFRLAHVGSYRNAELQSFDQRFVVGLSEIFGVREFDRDNFTPEDQQFLGRVSTFIANTH